jgi:hypothetical protein
MVRSNFVLERAAEKAEFKKPRTALSCSRKDRRVLWRDILHGDTWSQPKKHASGFVTISKEPSYEHLCLKAQRRYGCGVVSLSEQIRIPRWFLSPEIDSLRKAIEKSRSILELKDNGDDAESVSESTWNRAQSFLIKNALKLWRSHKTCFDPPKIRSVGDGTIDLHWKSPTRELLINVPAGSQEPIGYYGDDRAEGTKDAVRGKDLESSPDAEWIFLWLTK